MKKSYPTIITDLLFLLLLMLLLLPACSGTGTSVLDTGLGHVTQKGSAVMAANKVPNDTLEQDGSASDSATKGTETQPGADMTTDNESSIQNRSAGDRVNESSASEQRADSIALTDSANLKANEPIQIKISAIGDIILHQAVIDGDGSSNYNPIFKNVAASLQSADFAIAGYEGTLNGPPYSGYPLFGGPDEIAKALQNAGIAMVTTANNHVLDRGLSGVIRTPQVFQKLGMTVVGTRSKKTDATFSVQDIGGIKVGFTAYTWETIGTETQRTINGIPLPKGTEDLIDSFNPSRAERYKKDLAGMKQRIADMRHSGAECIVFLIHWGEEYNTTSSAMQQKMAKFLAENGVDVIFGYHPHVLQEIAVLPQPVNKKNLLVFYSLSGFVSNMEFGTHGTKGYAEDAIIASAVIQKEVDGFVHVVKGAYEGTYMLKENILGHRMHRAIPVRAALADPAGYAVGKSLAQIEKSARRTETVMKKNSPLEGTILEEVKK